MCFLPILFWLLAASSLATWLQRTLNSTKEGRRMSVSKSQILATRTCFVHIHIILRPYDASTCVYIYLCMYGCGRISIELRIVKMSETWDVLISSAQNRRSVKCCCRPEITKPMNFTRFWRVVTRLKADTTKCSILIDSAKAFQKALYAVHLAELERFEADSFCIISKHNASPQ